MTPSMTWRGAGAGALRRAWTPCRRALYWVHRWLGILGCLLFVMWFASGLVMMYVGFPELTNEERLAGLPLLQAGAARVGPEEALSTLPAAVRGLAPRRVALEMLGAEPVWRIQDGQGGRHTVSARDARPSGATDAAQAEAIGQAFSRHLEARWVETLERDQWTVPNGLNPLRPLHRIEVGDAAGTELYVSSVNGEVVRDTTRRERFWNWLGAVPHWIYFTPLRADPPLWREVVLWVSGASIASAVTGLVIGVLRVRLRGRRYKGGAVTPYRGWFAWHHVVGLVGGVFVLTWIVSGWLSMDPNRWFQRAAPDAVAQARYLGAVPAGGEGWSLSLHAPADAREMQWLWFGGHALLQWRDGAGGRTVVETGSGAPAVVGEAEVLAAARRLTGLEKGLEKGAVDTGASTSAAASPRLVWLTQEDAHWYSHHHARLLPVWRVVLGDAAGTWLHVDPATGQILGTSDETSRARRWLFNGAHSLDFPWLIQHRPAWDLVVWLLSIAGLVVSVSGVVLGWWRLRGRRMGVKRLPRLPTSR